MKTCNACKSSLPLSDFHRRNASLDGLSYTCKKCSKLAGARYYSKNKKEVLQRVRDWQVSNPDRRKISRTRWDSANKEKKAKSTRERRERYKLERPDYLKQMNRYAAARRRSQIKASGAHVPASWWRALFDINETGVCLYCKRMGEKLVMDHFVPLAKGGKHEVGNLVAVCQRCNAQKGSKMPQDFLPVDGYEAIVSFLDCTRAAYEESIGEAA